MPNPAYDLRTGTGIIPERQIKGRGWCQVPVHQAQKFAAYFKGRLVTRAPTLHKAELAFANTVLRKAKPARAYRLGSRMPKLEKGTD